MGTRGRLTFIFNGKVIHTWNRFDSYPSGLGVAIVLSIIDLIQNQYLSLEVIRDMFENLRVIDKDTEITEDDINTLEPFADPFFKEYDFDYPKWTWSSLLRQCEGSIRKILESGCILSNDCNVIDWAYAVNWDNGTCEVINEGSIIIPFDQLSIERMRSLEENWDCPSHA